MWGGVRVLDLEISLCLLPLLLDVLLRPSLSLSLGRRVRVGAAED